MCTTCCVMTYSTFLHCRGLVSFALNEIKFMFTRETCSGLGCCGCLPSLIMNPRAFTLHCKPCTKAKRSSISLVCRAWAVSVLCNCFSRVDDCHCSGCILDTLGQGLGAASQHPWVTAAHSSPGAVGAWSWGASLAWGAGQDGGCGATFGGTTFAGCLGVFPSAKGALSA